MKPSTPTKAELEQRLAEVMATVERARKKALAERRRLIGRGPISEACAVGADVALRNLSRQLKRKAGGK